MNTYRVATVLAGMVLACAAVQAVEIPDLRGFEALFGRYAPAGDCTRLPRIAVDASGITFETRAGTEKVVQLEYAASFAGPSCAGIGHWFFPFRNANGYPVIMNFNADERAGLLTVQPNDEGWEGGPKLGAKYQPLVAASPYAKCK